MELSTLNKWIIPEKNKCLYTSCYCEENIWKLCEYVLHNQAGSISNYFVVFISNKNQTVPLWKQQSGKLEDNLAIWDYHVILIYCTPDNSANVVYDLDSILDYPVDFSEYAMHTFRTDFTLKENYHRKFRVIPAKLYLDQLSSDRSRMRKDGAWIKPPPPYPCIQAPGLENNLEDFISMNSSIQLGEVHDLNQFLERFSLS